MYKRKRVIKFMALLMCFILMGNTPFSSIQGYAADITVKSVDIIPKYGILLGESIKMEATVSPEDAWLSGVEWSSDNPEVISCTKDGLIKGLKAGESAVIRCKSKMGSASDSIKIYCVEKLPSVVTTNMKGILTFICSKPSSVSIVDFHFNAIKVFPTLRSVLQALALIGAYPLSPSSAPMSSACRGNVKVYGRISNYAYIRYNVNGESYSDGFVKYNALEKTLSGFLYLSAKDINVWANGKVYEQKKLTSDYKKAVSWEVADDENTIKFDDVTGQITGINPGTTTITARADGMEDVCYVHCLYQWKQTWTTKTNKNTYLYAAVGEGYKTIKAMDKETDFVVHGDTGASDGWAFGKIRKTNTWGYVPIRDVSTKGTISQYNNLTTTIIVNNKEVEVPWVWPVLNEIESVTKSQNANYISSLYAPRSDSTSEVIHHRGIDITTGTPGAIKEYSVVSAASGIVNAIRPNVDGCGFCVSISSDCLDPVTGQNIAIIYMHLHEAPKYSNGKNVKVGDEISAGTIIGKVGKTNGNTKPDMGYHLHFETNNRNAAVGDSGRSDFANTINPLHFYLSKTIRIDEDSEAYKKGYTEYWYNMNK